MLAPLIAAVLLVAPAPPSRTVAPAPPSRIVFASARTGVAQLYSVEPSGDGLAQLTFGAGNWSYPVLSPDGRFVAAFRGPDQLWVMRGDGRQPRLLAEDARGSPSWSSNSRRLVFVAGGAIWTAAAAGGAPRQVTNGLSDTAPALSPDGGSIAFLRPESSGAMLVVRRRGRERIVLHHVAYLRPAWSPDGKWITVAAGAAPTLELVRPTGGAPKVVNDCASCAYSPSAWSPDGRRLAYVDRWGIHVVERSGPGRRLLVPAYLTANWPWPAWSPSGNAIAFATDSGVQIVTLAGPARTLVPFGPHEAQPGVGWSRAPSDLTYKTPEETPLLVRVSPRELRARVPIEQFSADGARVAYWLCPHSFGAWRPGDERPVSMGPPSLVSCQPPENEFGNYVSDLALAGDRVAYLTGLAANSVYTNLMLTTLERGDEGITIVENVHHYGQRPALDDVLGAGPTIVYGSREALDTSLQGPETIWRVDHTKPVQITYAPEDLQPLALDQGRIVARRHDGSLELLDLVGGVPRTLDVSARGAALAGDDLVVHVRGELRDYSASTGELLHVWPLPAVRGAKLDDAARGVAVYTLKGVVHLLRLRDGANRTVRRATAAELTNAGLFYSFVGKKPWPGRIRFVPFSELRFR
jgi:Tol biopolymer transport system component